MLDAMDVDTQKAICLDFGVARQYHRQRRSVDCLVVRGALAKKAACASIIKLGWIWTRPSMAKKRSVFGSSIAP